MDWPLFWVWVIAVAGMISWMFIAFRTAMEDTALAVLTTVALCFLAWIFWSYVWSPWLYVEKMHL